MVALNKTTFTALAAAAQLFNIVDFEGHFLDLAFSTTTDGNPIIGDTPNNPPTLNQQVSCQLYAASPLSHSVCSPRAWYSVADDETIVVCQPGLWRQPRTISDSECSRAIFVLLYRICRWSGGIYFCSRELRVSSHIRSQLLGRWRNYVSDEVQVSW